MTKDLIFLSMNHFSLEAAKWHLFKGGILLKTAFKSKNQAYLRTQQNLLMQLRKIKLYT